MGNRLANWQQQRTTGCIVVSFLQWVGSTQDVNWCHILLRVTNWMGNTRLVTSISRADRFYKAQLQDSYCPCGPTRTPHQSIWYVQWLSVLIRSSRKAISLVDLTDIDLRRAGDQTERDHLGHKTTNRWILGCWETAWSCTDAGTILTDRPRMWYGMTHEFKWFVEIESGCYGVSGQNVNVAVLLWC